MKETYLVKRDVLHFEMTYTSIKVSFHISMSILSKETHLVSLLWISFMSKETYNCAPKETWNFVKRDVIRDVSRFGITSHRGKLYRSFFIHICLYGPLFMYIRHFWRIWRSLWRFWITSSFIYVCHDDSFICVTWLIRMCDMTRSYVWHDSFICATWLVHICDMSHSYVRHDSFIRVTCLIHTCDMTRSYVWHDSFICVTWLDSRTTPQPEPKSPFNIRMSHVARMHTACHTYEWVMSRTWMSHVTHMNESRHRHERVMSQTWTSHATHMNKSCHTNE